MWCMQYTCTFTHYAQKIFYCGLINPAEGSLLDVILSCCCCCCCLMLFFLHTIRNRLRQYPAFVNCTTIDWFSEWPKDALLEVAEKYLEDVNLGPDGDEVGNMYST